MSKEVKKIKSPENIVPSKPKEQTKLMVNVSTSKNSKGMFSETKKKS